MSENIKLESLLNDPSLLAKKAYVAGEWINAQNGKTFDVINPATGEIIASLPDLDVSDAKHAIDAAALAQKKWAQYTGKERAAILREMY
ncbi:aldehyde dehydrogenase family protein, partial [bacterium]|nr:aldehyde dehydrogenase family protein [bacterium]